MRIPPPSLRSFVHNVYHAAGDASRAGTKDCIRVDEGPPRPHESTIPNALSQNSELTLRVLCRNASLPTLSSYLLSTSIIPRVGSFCGLRRMSLCQHASKCSYPVNGMIRSLPSYYDLATGPSFRSYTLWELDLRRVSRYTISPACNV